MLKAAEFRTPPVLLQGPGSLALLSRELKRLGKNKALFVTDSNLIRAGYANPIIRTLGEAQIPFVTFEKNGNEEADDRHVETGLEDYRKHTCDFIIALGGGSVIDLGKGIAITEATGGRITDYIDADTPPAPPLVAIASTSGSGAEATQYAMIRDTEKGIIRLIHSPYILPVLAVTDPILTFSVPPSLTAISGIQALCNAMEALASKKEHPMGDTLALHSLRLISGNLLKCWCNGDDLKARANMMLASTQAGIALSNASPTLLQAMSRALSAHFSIPYGLASAILLPVWTRYSSIAKPEKFSEIFKALGQSKRALSPADAASKTSKAIQKLCRKLEIPPLNHFIKAPETLEKKIDRMASDALAGGSAGHNPRFVTNARIIELYQEAYDSSLQA